MFKIVNFSQEKLQRPTRAGQHAERELDYGTNRVGNDSPIVRLGAALPIRRWLEYGLLVAVSGGADSTALLYALARFAKDFGTADPVVGHVNHRLRGEESDGDARFVRETARDLALRYVEHAVESAEWNTDDSGSREAAARRIRYDFLQSTAEELGLRYVATAHTRDDQVETVLHRILRGTGISGLRGIGRFRPLGGAVTLVRPFLEIRRRDVLSFLHALGRSFRIDSSNRANDFTRNRLRNRLLPLLREEFNPKVDEALIRLALLADDAEDLRDGLLDEFARRVVLRHSTSEILLDASKLRTVKPALLRELFVRLWKLGGWPLRGMGFEQWSRLVDFFCNGTGRRKLKGQVVAEHRDERFILRRDGEDSEA